MKNFYTKALLALTALMIFAATACAKPKQYPYRFVYVTGRALDNPDLVGDIREIAKTAGEHGLTGLVLDAYFDRLPQEPPYNFKNLREIVSICKENGLEFVPALMGMGYNAPMLSNDRHLLEGLPVKDALFIVQGGKANVMADPPVSIAGSGFEKEENGRPAGWEVVAGEGAAVRVDRKEAYDGNSSLKVEISGEFAEGSAIVSQEISVHPYRCYRLRCMVKTEGVESRGDVFPILVKSPDGRRLQYYIPPLKDNAGWMQAEVGFNSKHYEKVVLSVGAPESSGGKFWIDSYTIAEDGLVNVLRRGGTPLVVRGENSGIEYEEGKDFAPVYDPVMTLLFDHEAPPIEILPGGRIIEGERLRVSFYNNHAIYNGQTPVCFSEPKVYEYWRKAVRFLHEYIRPNMYYLSADELRLAGTCALCKSRGMSVVEMLGDCLHKQREIIKELNPEAELFVWSDMFDPNHNANDRHGDYYYLSDENFENSWKYIPKDIVIVCWYHKVRDRSLKHFSDNGFRTIGSSSGNLETARGWLESLDATKSAMGIMYTTWSNDYSVLADFGDLVNRKIK